MWRVSPTAAPPLPARHSTSRIRTVFASGSPGSYALRFRRCYEAAALAIAGVLQWMDRSAIVVAAGPGHEVDVGLLLSFLGA